MIMRATDGGLQNATDKIRGELERTSPKGNNQRKGKRINDRSGDGLREAIPNFRLNVNARGRGEPWLLENRTRRHQPGSGGEENSQSEPCREPEGHRHRQGGQPDHLPLAFVSPWWLVASATAPRTRAADSGARANGGMRGTGGRPRPCRRRRNVTGKRLGLPSGVGLLCFCRLNFDDCSSKRLAAG